MIRRLWWPALVGISLGVLVWCLPERARWAATAGLLAANAVVLLLGSREVRRERRASDGGRLTATVNNCSKQSANTNALDQDARDCKRSGERVCRRNSPGHTLDAPW